MALLAGLMWSFGAVTARLADGSDAFQYLAWRSVGIIAVIEGWRLARRQRLHSITAFTTGPRMLIANVCLLTASLGFIYAVKTTSVATAAFLGSTTPLFGVLASRVFLGERANRRTLISIMVAFIGLLVMLVDNLDAGNLVGDLAAVTAAVGFAAYTTVVRSDPKRDWSPVMPGYSLMMIAICATVIVSNGDQLVPPTQDIGWALVHGGLFIVAGTRLYNGASRTIPAAAMTVFAQSEMVLVPLWAFLVLAEQPSTQTLIGGAIIVAAVIGKATLDGRTQPAPTQQNRMALPA